METWEVAARESIRDLVAKYNLRGDAGKIAAMIELFTAEAVLEFADRSYCGPREIRELFDSAAASTQERRGAHLRHFVATHEIELVDRRSARGRSYFLVLTEAGLDHWGRYVDEYQCAEERWHFSRRRITVDGFVPGGWAARRVGNSSSGQHP